jgi:SAM-dependent methyltransferase
LATGESRDLHKGFRDPGKAVSEELTAFLEEADRLPGLQVIHRAMRQALRPWPGARLLDAGCGIGLEATRLADEYPEVQVTGLDLNADLLDAARNRGNGRPNLAWVQADLTDPALPTDTYDLIRTERVLMYLPGSRFDEGVGALLRQLRPGGRLVSFELDYGATILSPELEPEVTRELIAALERSLPQPWAGRRLPKVLADRGAVEVTAEPYAFSVDEAVWEAIVVKTLRLAAAENRLSRAAAEQFEAHAAEAARSPFLASFCGVLATATKPG